MNFKTFKQVAVIGTAIVALGYMSDVAKAAPTATVTASITTSSTITALTGVNMDFGTWLVGVHAADAPTITMNSATGAYTIGAVGSSQIKNLGAATGTPGSATITLPTGADGIVVQMSLDTLTDFPGASGLSMTGITYSTLTEADTAIIQGGATQPVTNVLGGAPETIKFGGTITATATPTDGNYAGSIDVSFDY